MNIIFVSNFHLTLDTYEYLEIQWFLNTENVYIQNFFSLSDLPASQQIFAYPSTTSFCKVCDGRSVQNNAHHFEGFQANDYHNQYMHNSTHNMHAPVHHDTNHHHQHSHHDHHDHQQHQQQGT